MNGFATGAVQVFHNGAFGAVCNEGFDAAAADVACRQLGFVGGTNIPLAIRGSLGNRQQRSLIEVRASFMCKMYVLLSHHRQRYAAFHCAALSWLVSLCISDFHKQRHRSGYLTPCKCAFHVCVLEEMPSLRMARFRWSCLPASVHTCQSTLTTGALGLMFWTFYSEDFWICCDVAFQ